MPNFKFDSQSFFLTYPQSGDLEWQQIIDHIASVADIAWARIAREEHQDGNPHFHVVGKFTRRFQTRNERIFDVQQQHPNIQPVRSIKHALAYVSKDGEFHDIGTIPTSASSNFNIMAAAKELSEPDYWQACLEHRIPYQYGLKFFEMQKAKNQSTIDSSYEPDISRECAELQELTLQPMATHIVIGPTGVGKTQWAKRIAPKPSLWVRHIDMLRAFRVGYHQSIVFDDIVFTHYPREAQIHLADWQDEAHIHCRYGIGIVPAGTPRIFTANREVFIDDPAINRRCFKSYIVGL